MQGLTLINARINTDALRVFNPSPYPFICRKRASFPLAQTSAAAYRLSARHFGAG
jgi:hypothetical protein